MEAGTTVQIRMPEMGESVTEGTILEWLVQVGDEVETDQGLVEVSTDKVDTEVPSPASGVITKILVDPDETVPVGTVLGEISPSGSNGGAPPAPAEEDPEWAADESAVEEAEHGAAAEEENEAAKEALDGIAPEQPSTGAGPATGGEVMDVAVPEMGESVSEGTVLDWLVKVGDQVEKDQGLVEISTDKVDAELPSPAAGTVVEILAAPDDVVATGTVVARIAIGEVAGGRSQVAGPEAPAQPATANGGNGAGNATPVAARMAAQHGIDVNQLEGSGPRGR